MRRWNVVGLLVVGVAVVSAAGAQAQTTTTDPASTTTSIVVVETLVTVEGGAARQADFAQPCNDLILGVEERLSFVLRRTGPTTAPLTVTYRVSGSAQAGVHYDPLAGSVTFAEGASSVVVPVVPRQTPRGALVELTLEVTGGTPLAPPTPPSATIQFVSPPAPGPHECGYFFTDEPWNTSQTIAVGGVPRSLTLEEAAIPLIAPAEGVFRVVAGTLPSGVELRTDGSFAGAATAAGTFSARIEACRPRPPGTCVTTDLTVVVTSQIVQRPPLPRTGPPPPAVGLIGLTALSLGLLGVGWALARPRPRPPQPL